MQLSVYLQKFRNRLKGKNRVYVTQLVRLIDSLTTYLEAKSDQGGSLEGQILVGELVAGKGVDQINLHKLMRYLQESKLARKVEGYHNFSQQQPLIKKETTTLAPSKPSPTPTLSHVQSFLNALTDPSNEGRFFYSRTESQECTSTQIILKYLLLDPTQHFKEIVDEARAVVLAGGTMSPVRSCLYLTSHPLLTHVKDERLHKQSFPLFAIRAYSDAFLRPRHTSSKSAGSPCLKRTVRC